MQTEESPKVVHEGRNVKRIREIFGIKQEALAMDLGLSQQAVSQLEQKETLDKEMLEKVARALKSHLKPLRTLVNKIQFTTYRITMRVLTLV